MGLGDEFGDGQEEGLDALQARLEEAAAEVKGTRHKNKFKIPDEVRMMATAAAKCRNLIQREKGTNSPKRI